MRILKWLGLALATFLTIIVVVVYAYSLALFLTDCSLEYQENVNVDLPACVALNFTDSGVRLGACPTSPKDANADQQ